jgi:diacylglycerol kinase family enzyme
MAMDPQSAKTATPLPIGPSRFVVHNSHAGTGELPDGLFDAFTTITVDDLANVLKTSPPASLVAVWGGDGTSRSVAAIAVDSNVVVLPCPGGTHNHFAKAAGFATTSDVQDALRQPEAGLVDVGTVNDEVFLNNLSIGWYADLVARRERLEKRMPRRLAKIVSVIAHLGAIRRLSVRIDGIPERVWMIWIGNGRYPTEVGRVPQRANMTDGLIDIRFLRAGTSFPKLKALAAITRGKAEASSHIEQRLATRCALEFRTDTIEVALDGEHLSLTNPLLVSTRQSLRLLKPS